MHYACMEMEHRNGEVGERGCGMVAWQMGGGQDIQKGIVELLYRRAFTNRLSSGYDRNEGVFGNRALHPYK